jgi:hypothetical protein
MLRGPRRATLTTWTAEAAVIEPAALDFQLQQLLVLLLHQQRPL